MVSDEDVVQTFDSKVEEEVASGRAVWLDIGAWLASGARHHTLSHLSPDVAMRDHVLLPRFAVNEGWRWKASAVFLSADKHARRALRRVSGV